MNEPSPRHLHRTEMTHLLEIRTHRLKPGTIDAFHDAVRLKAVPMLRSTGMDVVAYGRSDHEEEHYFLVRAYASRAELENEQADFYGSEQWKNGPRSERSTGSKPT